MTEPDPKAVEFIKKKAKEKGLKPKYPKGMNPKEQQAGNLLDHKLNVLESGHTSMGFKLDEMMRYISGVDSKISNLMNGVEDLKTEIISLKSDIDSLKKEG